MRTGKLASLLLIFFLIIGLASALAANYADVDRYISSGLVLGTVGAYQYSIASLEAGVEQALTIEQRAEAETALGLVYYVAAQDAMENGKSPQTLLAKARSHWENAIELDVDNSFLYGQLGNVYLALGDLADAKVAFETVLQYEPDAVMALYGLGRISSLMGEPDKAVSVLERAVKISPDHVEAAILLAEQLILLNRASDAVQTLKTAESWNPRVPDLHYQLARAYHLDGDKNKAVHELERALQLDPDHVNANVFLQSIKNE